MHINWALATISFLSIAEPAVAQVKFLHCVGTSSFAQGPARPTGFAFLIDVEERQICGAFWNEVISASEAADEERYLTSACASGRVPDEPSLRLSVSQSPETITIRTIEDGRDILTYEIDRRSLDFRRYNSGGQYASRGSGTCTVRSVSYQFAAPQL